MSETVKLARTADISPGAAKAFDVGGRRIAVFNQDGTFYAVDDACTHRGGSLSEGAVEGGCVTCPLHRAVFDLKTGEAKAGPAPSPIACFPVSVEGEDLLVSV